MKCVPTELLEEIFLFSISQSQPHSNSHPRICSRSPTSPSVISKICRRWRDVALNFPPLWNHLHVVDPQHPSILQDLHVWMHRAGTFPLCLSVCQHESNDSQAIAAVVTLFLNSINRCQYFGLFLSMVDLDLFPLGNIERFPSISLESVSICCPNLKWTESRNLGLLADLLLTLPSLRTIRWSCGVTKPLIPHSWENLRQLSTDSVGTLAEFFGALSQCQNLERLGIHAHPIDFDESVVVPPLSLPGVTHLSVALVSSSRRMLSLLKFQSLVDLKVILSRKQPPLASLLDMIQRSDVILRRLRITNRVIGRYGRLAQAQALNALKMPYFQELKILEIEELALAGGDTLKFLTLPNTSDPSANGTNEDSRPFGYLMNLERICLVSRDTLATLSQALQELIKSRPAMLYGPETTSEHIDTPIRISLSIPSALLLT